MPAFSDVARSLMAKLLDRLRAFQLAAFMIDPDKWKKGKLNSVLVSYAIDHAKMLLPLLEKPAKSADDMKKINELGWILGQFTRTTDMYRDASAGLVFEKSQATYRGRLDLVPFLGPAA
jgi:hypothetical protein